MRGRKTPQRPLEELRDQNSPGDKGRLYTGLCSKMLSNRRLVLVGSQLCEARGEFTLSTLVKVSTRMIRGPVLKIVKERTRDRRENRLPAQEAKQRIDKCIFHVVNGGLAIGLLRKQIPHEVFDGVAVARRVHRHIEGSNTRLLTRLCHGETELAIQARPQ